LFRQVKRLLLCHRRREVEAAFRCRREVGAAFRCRREVEAVVLKVEPAVVVPEVVVQAFRW
jgi:hypothetical protein